MPGVEPREIDEVEVETGLGAGGDDQERDEGERERAVPEQAGDDQYQEEIKAVKELLMVGVLHFPHPAELLHPGLNFEFFLSHNPDSAAFKPVGQPCGCCRWTYS